MGQESVISLTGDGKNAKLLALGENLTDCHTINQKEDIDVRIRRQLLLLWAAIVVIYGTSLLAAPKKTAFYGGCCWDNSWCNPPEICESPLACPAYSGICVAH